MTYDSLFTDFSAVYEYFINLGTRVFSFISDYPVLVFAVMIIVCFPALPYVFDFLYSASDSSSDITTDTIGIYRSFQLKKKKKEEKEMRESFRRDKEHNKQVMYDQGKHLADIFFSNNPQRMSIRINGFTYYQNGFENKHWGNSKKTRVTKKYKIDENGELYFSNQFISSTETYDNTSSQHLEEKYDAD